MPLLRFFQTIFILLFLGACASTVKVPQAQAQELPQPMGMGLSQLAIPSTSVGLYVQDVESGKLLAAFNSSAPFNPASLMKLVTTNAALDVLGPTFTWKTQAYANGTIVGDTLQGDLIIKGSGDPKLVLENLWMFLRRLRANGIREISGNLQLDRTAFESTVYDAGAFDGDPLKPYNAGPDALLLNYKAMTFRFMPDTKNGHARVLADPGLAGYTLTMPVLLNEDCGDWKTKLQPVFHSHGTAFMGGYPASCGEKLWHVHPYQITHSQYFDAVFRQIWMELGGVLKGELTSGPVPAGAYLLGEWQSTSLPEVIRDINKYSNNVMARQLLLTLGAVSNPVPANAQTGAAAVKAWLASKGIDAPELVIENGSGLSRNERISASTLGRMLVAAYRSPMMPELISSLPLAGYDGSMRQRVKNHSVAGYAHIKTGSLADVRSIAGYVLAKSGKRYAVVSIVNHPNANLVQQAHDSLLQWIYEQG